MYELNCNGVIPGCQRVIRADSPAEVVRRAVMQARQLGVERITPSMMDLFRQGTTEHRN